jgi:hypothetical protein
MLTIRLGRRDFPLPELTFCAALRGADKYFFGSESKTSRYDISRHLGGYDGPMPVISDWASCNH